jgi:molybdate transport system ATP-binding protein
LNTGGCDERPPAVFGMKTVERLPTDPELLFLLNNAELRIRARRVFHNTTWQILRGEAWVVLGPNGSGKSTLAGAIDGSTTVVAGSVFRAETIGAQRKTGDRVSPELARYIVEREFNSDHRRYAAGRPTDVLLARDLLTEILDDNENGTESLRLLDRYDVTRLFDTPVRHLSSGELKRLLIARALATPTDLTVFDEPFDGLDVTAQRLLAEDLEEYANADNPRSLVLVTHRIEEIPPNFGNVLSTLDCRVSAIGGRELIPSYPAGNTRVDIRSKVSPANGFAPATESELIVELHSVRVAYDESVLFSDFDWSMREGEHWSIVGPNGSGKTTILNLIYGDNLLAYANDVRVFGVRRGDGESIWELRRRIGYVTPTLNLRYTLDLDVTDVVASGFFDSVGLYRRPTDEQLERTRGLLNTLGINDLVPRRFRLLSAGERALVLIARALVKSPRLLILDEPCQGLDDGSRVCVLEAINKIGRSRESNLIYVTHHADEIPGCITHTLNLSRETG